MPRILCSLSSEFLVAVPDLHPNGRNVHHADSLPLLVVAIHRQPMTTGAVKPAFPDLPPTSATLSPPQKRTKGMKAEIDVIFGWSGTAETKTDANLEACSWTETATPPLIQDKLALTPLENDSTLSPTPSDSSGASVQTSLEQPSGGAEMADRSLSVLGLQPDLSYPALDEIHNPKSFSIDFASPAPPKVSHSVVP